MPKGMPDKGYAMTPARKHILDILIENGPIEDDNGRAVAKLMGYTGHSTTNSLSGVLEAMEKSKMIRRHVVGRRTYSIEAVPENLAPEDAPAPKKVRAKLRAVPAEEPTVAATSLEGVDLDLLAGVLLKKALLATQAQEVGADVKTLREQLTRAEGQTVYYRDAYEVVRSEVAELKALVKTLEHNNSVLAASMDKVRKDGGTQIKKLISAQELRELDQLMKALPSAR